MQMLAALCLLALAALLAGLVARWLVLRLARHLRESLRADWAAVFLHDSVLRRLARAVPSLMVQFGIPAVPALQPRWATAIANAAILAARYQPSPAPLPARLPATTLLNQRRRRRPEHPQPTPSPFTGFGGNPSP